MTLLRRVSGDFPDQIVLHGRAESERPLGLSAAHPPGNSQENHRALQGRVVPLASNPPSFLI